MRKNIFLHFLNRDSREIFGLYNFHTEHQHIAIIKQALNASFLLCEDHLVMPPGFAIEDELAFELSELNKDFFIDRYIHLPMRESNLTDYAEKKRLEYSPQRDRYSGLYDDRRLSFLGKYATGIVPRKSRIGEKIVSGWEAAADRGRLWVRTKTLLPAQTIISVRTVATNVMEDGAAVTWAEISKRLTAKSSPCSSGAKKLAAAHLFQTVLPRI